MDHYFPQPMNLLLNWAFVRIQSLTPFSSFSHLLQTFISVPGTVIITEIGEVTFKAFQLLTQASVLETLHLMYISWHSECFKSIENPGLALLTSSFISSFSSLLPQEEDMDLHIKSPDDYWHHCSYLGLRWTLQDSNIVFLDISRACKSYWNSEIISLLWVARRRFFDFTKNNGNFVLLVVESSFKFHFSFRRFLFIPVWITLWRMVYKTIF